MVLCHSGICESCNSDAVSGRRQHLPEHHVCLHWRRPATVVSFHAVYHWRVVSAIAKPVSRTEHRCSVISTAVRRMVNLFLCVFALTMLVGLQEWGISLFLSVSSQVVVDQRTRPQVHARLHGLVTPPRVRRSSFQSASQCSPRSLVEDGHVLLCHELSGIAHRYWHVENVCFRACDQESTMGHLVCEVLLQKWTFWRASDHAVTLEKLTCWAENRK